MSYSDNIYELTCLKKDQELIVPGHIIKLVCEEPVHYCKFHSPCPKNCNSRYIT